MEEQEKKIVQEALRNRRIRGRAASVKAVLATACGLGENAHARAPGERGKGARGARRSAQARDPEIGGRVGGLPAAGFPF